MSDLKVDGITAATANTAVTIKGLGTGKVVLGDGELIFPDADGSAGQYIKSDGSANLAFATLPTAGFTLGTPVASTSGTSIDFTGIPSGTKQITLTFTGVSTNGTSHPIIQLGDSGGVETSGYLGTGAVLAAGPAYALFTAGLGIVASGGGWATTRFVHGIITLTLQDASTFTWAGSAWLAGSDAANFYVGGTGKSLSAELDRVRVTTVGGSDTFDAGKINIAYI